MRKVSFFGAAVMAAAASVACGRTTTADKEGRTATAVKLTGCVQAAPGFHEYVLRDVQNAEPAEQPVAAATMEHGYAVPDGSWARISASSLNLEEYLGKRVEVTGRVADSGANTIGTAGSEQDKFARSSRDASSPTDRAQPPSTVAPASSNANGTAPLIAAETITKESDTCGQEERVKKGVTGIGGRRAPAEGNAAVPFSHR